MREISEPLYKTEKENRRELADYEHANAQRIAEQGYSEGNRHERRLAAKRARKERHRVTL
jgi:hypothetical protein